MFLQWGNLLHLYVLTQTQSSSSHDEEQHLEPELSSTQIRVEWGRGLLYLSILLGSFLHRSGVADNFRKHSWKKKCLHSKSRTLETTENDAVPSAGLVRRCMFNPRRQKKKTWDTACTLSMQLTNKVAPRRRQRSLSRKTEWMKARV